MGKKRTKPGKKSLVEKVEAVSAHEGLAGPGAFAHAASTEQEEAAFRRDRDPLEYRLVHLAVILRRKTPAWCTNLQETRAMGAHFLGERSEAGQVGQSPCACPASHERDRQGGVRYAALRVSSAGYRW